MNARIGTMNDTNEPNTEIENAEAVADALAEWWHASARDLPWRFGRTTAWGVLVSGSDEPADADEPCGTVLERLDGALA